MSTLTIAGTAYSATGRTAVRCLIDRLTLSVDEAATFDFHQFGQTLPPTWHPGQTVVWDDGGNPIFSGEIVTAIPAFTPLGWTVAYSCQGLKYVGGKIAVTNSFDGTGTITFNLPLEDEDYLAANSGLSVGTMLTRLWTEHATQLAAAGIAGYVAGDYTALTLVPPSPVTFQGPNLFNAADTFLDQWAGLYSCWVEYQSGTTDWRIRVANTTTFTPTTLTLGTDPIEPPSIARDSSNAYSKVVIRGKAKIEPLFDSTLDLTLTKTWSAPDEASWKWSDWIAPAGATDYGTITVLTSTTATVQSHDAARTWITNFWSINQGGIWVINNVATDILQQEFRQIISAGAMTAGGTALITFDRPLENGGYTKYRMVCQPPGTKVDVWRRYNVTNTVAMGHLVKRFNVPVSWANNGAVLKETYPIGAIVYKSINFPATFEVDPINNQIRFTQPVVATINAQTALDQGGTAVTPPTDVLALIAYSRGTLTATKPTSSYEGTSFTADGIQRVWYIDEPQWVNAGAQAQYDALAQIRLDTVKNTVLSGTVVYHGKYSAGLTLGLAMNITGNTYTTGWEAINAPVRSFTLQWPDDGASNWISTFAINNRRKQATGDSFFVHPAFTGTAAWEVSGKGFVQGQATPVGADMSQMGTPETGGGYADMGGADLGANMTPQAGGGLGSQSNTTPSKKRAEDLAKRAHPRLAASKRKAAERAARARNRASKQQRSDDTSGVSDLAAKLPYQPMSDEDVSDTIMGGGDSGGGDSGDSGPTMDGMDASSAEPMEGGDEG